MRRSSFIFKESHAFIEEQDNPSEKVAMVEEELDGIDIDGIGDLADLSRLMLIDEECGNLKVVVESLLEIITERRRRSFTSLHVLTM